MQQDVKKRKTLEVLCSSIQKNNYDLYLKHELMLEEERTARSELAEKFHERMNSVSKEIEGLKTTRLEEVEKNQAVRVKIQEKVAEYREHEEAYQKKMSVHQGKMGALETRFKDELENKIGGMYKKATDEKTKYDKVLANVNELSDQIKTYVNKFETLKDEITASQNTFTNFKMDADNSKAELMTLEMDIGSMQEAMAKEQQQAQQVKDERARLEKTIATMNGLKKALNLKMATAK